MVVAHHVLFVVRPYKHLARDFAGHDFIRHGAAKYVRGDVHTNTSECYFSIFKRGMKGVYQHCANKHLHRNATELEFRYNKLSANGVEDAERGDNALRAVADKWLTNRRAD